MEAETKTALRPGKPKQILRTLVAAREKPEDILRWVVEMSIENFSKTQTVDYHSREYHVASAQISIAEIMGVVPADVCSELKKAVEAAYLAAPLAELQGRSAPRGDGNG